MGRAPVPAVRMRQEANKFAAGCGAEIDPKGSPSPRRFGHDAVDPAQRVAGSKVHVQSALDRVGNEVRVLEVLAVVVDDVEIPVGRVREVHGSEPVVGGGKEFCVGRPAARNVGRPVRRDEIAVDQVPRPLAHENAPSKLLGKGVAQINRRAARGREIPFQLLDPAGPGLGVPPVPGGGAVDSPLLRRTDRKNRSRRATVIRNVLLGPFHHEVRIALQVARRDDGVPQMDSVVRDEPVPPLVVGLPELRVARGPLGQIP